jgi:hypothetical protein
MRGIWLVAAMGACIALSSCDQDQQQTAQALPPAPPPACACRPTAPQETAAAARMAGPIVHRRHHHWRSRDYARNEHRHWRGDYSRTDFTESVLAPYDYVSQSSVTTIETEDRYASNEERAAYMRGAIRDGRGNRDTIPASMTGRRLDPWAGYGVKCPWL